MSETRIELDNGKYTLISDNGKLSALRYGEPWRDLCGDNLVYWLAVEIEHLKELVNALADTLETAGNGVRWYAENHPHGNGSDWEMLSKIKATLSLVPEGKL